MLEHNDPPLPGHTDNWHTLRHEVRRKRNAGRKRRWRVKNQGSGEGYILTPGANDGEADSYGVGDFWALRHRSGQIDDTAIAGDTRAHLDGFVNGDSIVGRNVVVWYAGHFSHDVAHDHSSGGGAHRRPHPPARPLVSAAPRRCGPSGRAASSPASAAAPRPAG